jgi:subtilisin family serine protease
MFRSLTRKTLSAVLALCFTASGITSALADYSDYWPEFGSLASHNEWAMQAIGGDIAHQMGATGAGIKVAVLDSGVSPNIPGLASKVVAYKDFVSSQHPLEEHGTMTASTVAADYDPATGVGGIAPGVSLIIGRVCYLNSCDHEAAKKAVIWAVEQGARVISMSFSGWIDPEMNAILLAATQRGVVVVGALGNNGCSTYTRWGTQNISCAQGKTNESSQVSYAIPGVIAAGASDHFGGRAYFSSWGPNLDLMAPGVDNIAYDPIGATNGFGGTSAATPLIAGAAALVLEANSTLTAPQVQAILQATTRPALEVKPKVWDRCEKSVETNLWSCNQQVDSNLPQEFFTGAGILAADKAVLLARRMANHETSAAPNVTAGETSATVNWDGPSADLYVNSKLVARNATSPYAFTGQRRQSFAIQLQRGNEVSDPALAILHTLTIPKAPIIEEYNNQALITGRMDSLYISIDDVRVNDPDIVWMQSAFGQIGGVFEFVDGTIAPCTGYDGGPPEMVVRKFSFTCRIKMNISDTAGRFRLMTPDSVLGEQSKLFAVHLYPALPSIEVRTQHLSDDAIRFEWDSISHAQSYEYRYLPDGTLSCTTETSVDITGTLSQPSVFMVSAKPEANCQGNTIVASEYLSFRLLKPAPPKPTNIKIKEMATTYIDFDAPVSDPTNTWRIYRSDGAFMRYDTPGQRLAFGITKNEDANRKTFTYRFVEIAHTIWGESWSPPSDPVSASLANLLAPSGSCYATTSAMNVTCEINPNQSSDGTLIEFLDGDGQVVFSKDTKRWVSQKFKFGKLKSAHSVRLTSTAGDVGYWYRRGDSVTISINNRFVSNRYRTMIAQ